MFLVAAPVRGRAFSHCFTLGWGGVGQERPCTCKNNNVMLHHKNFFIAFPHRLRTTSYTFPVDTSCAELVGWGGEGQ